MGVPIVVYMLQVFLSVPGMQLPHCCEKPQVYLRTYGGQFSFTIQCASTTAHPVDRKGIQGECEGFFEKLEVSGVKPWLS